MRTENLETSARETIVALALDLRGYAFREVASTIVFEEAVAPPTELMIRAHAQIVRDMFGAVDTLLVVAEAFVTRQGAAEQVASVAAVLTRCAEKARAGGVSEHDLTLLAARTLATAEAINGGPARAAKERLDPRVCAAAGVGPIVMAATILGGAAATILGGAAVIVLRRRDDRTPCEACNGAGKCGEAGEECGACHGRGTVEAGR